MRLTRYYPSFPILFPILLPTLVMLAGCYKTYLVADVTTETRSIRDALVVAECGETFNSAKKTDAQGRVRLRLYGNLEFEECLVTIFKAGYETLKQRGIEWCNTSGPCVPTRYILRPIGGSNHE